MAAPHMAAPRFTAHASPHFSAARAHFASPQHMSHFSRAQFHGRAAANAAHAAVINNHGNAANLHANAHSLAATAHPLAAARALPAAQRAAFHSDPRAFAAHRNFAENGALRPFWRHGWHPFHHLGWIGPVFWPYAYGDFFYYALWPADYYDVDPFWAYGYADIYTAIFSPNDYDDYVQGPSAPARMATLTQSMAQSCSDEAAEVTGWPIDQIQAAVQPNPDQSALLDNLGNAVIQASDVIKSHCPTNVSFTPTGRIDAMQQRLAGMVQAVDIISPPLSKFYDSLSDEQKARFNDVTPPQNPQASNTPNPQAATPPTPQSGCDAAVMAWPTEQIDRTVQPNDAQRAKLEALQAAAANGANIIKAACPTQIPSTPPDRLAAVGNHLKAMLQAVATVQPALADFYNSLSDGQKARFNTMGKQLFAQTQE
jgi:hypothetical protein